MENRVDVVVFGAVFVDIKGFPRDVLNPSGTNVGNVEFKHGGVSRNVVENLSFMGLNSSFVSMVDNSALGMEVLERLKKEDINTDYVKIVEKDGMGMWLVVLNERGDIAASISHQPNLAPIYNLIDESCEEILRDTSSVVLDLDLRVEYLNKVIETASKLNKKVYGVIGNLDVISKSKDVLNKLDCLICNNIEFSAICNKELRDKSQILNEAKELTKGGLKKIVVTMGRQGSVYYDAESNIEGHVDIIPADVIDTTGAGDSFFAGTVFGLTKGYSLKDSVLVGTKIASLTISCSESTNCEIKNEMHKIAL